jgi:8-oxo-dGTP pyrophosphatase MutT (NUDIX family)
MKKKALLSHTYHQSAVIPYRIKEDKLQVLIISSTKSKRWVVPKGIIEPHLTSAESAAQEAWEEAGVKGLVHPVMVGTYTYKKWTGICQVEVFLLRVDEIFDKWLESFRKRKWVSVKNAAERMKEASLRDLILRLPTLIHQVTTEQSHE